MNKDGSQRLEDELSSFTSLMLQAKALFKNCLSEGPHIFCFEPSSPRFHVSVSCLTHGNEVGGLSVLNVFLKWFLQQDLSQEVAYSFCLGNVEAARANKRFLDRDLNRSFLRSKSESSSETNLKETLNREEKIAASYEPWIRKHGGQRRSFEKHFHLDLHQTNEPSASAFFMVAKRPEFLQFCSSLHENIPIVTFPEGNFSSDGKTLGEFVLSHGGLSLTLEMGEKGFRTEQDALAFEVLKNFYSVTRRSTGAPSVPNEIRGRVYERTYLVQNSPDKKWSLKSGFKNLAPINKGDLLIPEIQLHSPVEGLALFPKYGDLAKASAELMQVVAPLKQLP